MDSWLLTEKLPAICGRAIFAIVSSSANIKAANMVGAKISHLFALLWSFAILSMFTPIENSTPNSMLQWY